MRLRDWFGHRDEQSAAGPGSGPGELHVIRTAGNELLAAGDAAIERALSGDSEAFLEANRQQGGQ